MRILLDENVPVQLRSHLSEHDVTSVNDAYLGWKGIRNGLLLDRMDGRFDLLITADRNIYAQQNLAGRRLAILVLPTNRRRVVLGIAEKIADIVRGVHAGDYLVLDPSGAISGTPRTNP